ncbi:MFS transporter [Amycolatopsis mongoliensis]|uniref:MFS transporter n=1 Tax=Amycolatopsis mongoliensis TaxID=715475 RepID=A0A9Y2JIQ7_9PSEU|nr:MFS transporter [Amycolatopsis sp. 4-36]WIX98031.1 MFS transporter [Amycolatopsis sp. 4-36]
MVETDSRRWWALGLIASAQFMVIMDTSIIGVALPEMQKDLGFSPGGLSWVFNAYVIALGGLLLLGGRLSDLFGARRLFAAGWVITLGGSVVAALAATTWAELLGRVLQGAGAALIAPSALTLLMVLFGSRPRELTKALALYGAAAPAGGTAGVFLGGVITEWLSWPWIFWLYVPISLVAILATGRVMPTVSARRGSVDVLGAATVTAGLAVTVFAVVRAPQVGWGAFETLGPLVGGLVLLALFVVLQRVRQESLVRLGIFHTPNLGGANLAQFLLGAAWIPMWYFLNLYLQQVLGYGAFASGAALLPMTVLIVVLMVAVAPKLIAKLGSKTMIIGGLWALAAGLLWLSLARPTGTFVVDVLPASLVAALGQALAFIPSLGTAISSARPEEGGLAAGIVNTAYQVGSALGLAAMTAVGLSFGADRHDDPVVLTDGFSAAFLGASGIALAGGFLAMVTLRADKRTAEAPAEAAATR